jgi:hypothetical protein
MVRGKPDQERRTKWQIRDVLWPDLRRLDTAEKKGALLPSLILGLAMTSGLTIAAFGLITALIILRAGDGQFPYVFAAVTATPILFALIGFLTVIRMVFHFWVKDKTGE